MGSKLAVGDKLTYHTPAHVREILNPIPHIILDNWIIFFVIELEVHLIVGHLGFR